MGDSFVVGVSVEEYEVVTCHGREGACGVSGVCVCCEFD